MAELDEALVVEPEPGNVAFLGGLDQRGRTGAQRPALRVTDEVVPLSRKVEITAGRVLRPQSPWQQVM